MKCPHCNQEFPLTWGRYWSTGWVRHHCPHCRQYSRFQFTILVYLQYLSLVLLGVVFLGLISLAITGNWWFLGFVAGGSFAIPFITKFIGDRYLKLEKNPPRNIRNLLIDFSIRTILLVAVIGGFYFEENWRGSREWESTKKSLESAGESLDFNSYIPPRIPRDQNLAAIPLFKIERDPSQKNSLQYLSLKKALKNFSKDLGPLPKTGDWTKGEMADETVLKQWVSEHYKMVFPAEPQNFGTLEQIDSLCPAVNELRTAATTHPLCRFALDYTPRPPPVLNIPEIMPSMILALILKIHGTAALIENQPEIALDDFKLGIQIATGLRHEPILISGLVGMTITKIDLGIIWEGLQRHAWTETQLSELQQSLSVINFLSDYQLYLRGEATGFTIPEMDYFRNRYSQVVPKGWIDMEKARGVSFQLEATRELVDLQKHRVFSTKSDQFERKIESFDRYYRYFPSHMLLRLTSSMDSLPTTKFAQAQTLIDQAVIACALERYRLAHGAYPKSLNDLWPYFHDALPHDLFNGEMYHYKLQSDGKFLLYSVGWNQTDDGGVGVYKKDDPKNLDLKQGDWVWPIPKDVSSKDEVHPSGTTN